MGSRHLIPTTVVVGFPGIGKTYIAKKFPQLVRDLESSDFHWLKDEKTGEFLLDKKGEKILNPEWPENYISSIEVLNKSGMYRVVLIASNDQIREELGKRNIKYSNIYPENTPVMKKLIMDRYRSRQSSEEFIANIDKNWDKFIESLEQDEKAVVKIRLTPQTINEWQVRMLYV